MRYDSGVHISTVSRHSRCYTLQRSPRDNRHRAMPVAAGRVAGVFRRNWRAYVASLVLAEGASASSKDSAELVVPMDVRIPKIRIRTRLAAELLNHRCVNCTCMVGRGSLAAPHCPSPAWVSEHVRVRSAVGLPHTCVVLLLVGGAWYGVVLLVCRLVVRIDAWDVDSRYPSGHYVRSIGPVLHMDTEVEADMIETGLEGAS